MQAQAGACPPPSPPASPSPSPPPSTSASASTSASPSQNTRSRKVEEVAQAQLTKMLLRTRAPPAAPPPLPPPPAAAAAPSRAKGRSRPTDAENVHPSETESSNTHTHVQDQAKTQPQARKGKGRKRGKAPEELASGLGLATLDSFFKSKPAKVLEVLAERAEAESGEAIPVEIEVQDDEDDVIVVEDTTIQLCGSQNHKSDNGVIRNVYPIFQNPALDLRSSSKEGQVENTANDAESSTVQLGKRRIKPSRDIETEQESSEEEERSIGDEDSDGSSSSTAKRRKSRRLVKSKSRGSANAQRKNSSKRMCKNTTEYTDDVPHVKGNDFFLNKGERAKKKMIESAQKFREELERSRKLTAQISQGKELNPFFAQKPKRASNVVEIVEDDVSSPTTAWEEDVRFPRFQHVIAKGGIEENQGRARLDLLSVEKVMKVRRRGTDMSDAPNEPLSAYTHSEQCKSDLETLRSAVQSAEHAWTGLYTSGYVFSFPTPSKTARAGLLASPGHTTPYIVPGYGPGDVDGYFSARHEWSCEVKTNTIFTPLTEEDVLQLARFGGMLEDFNSSNLLRARERAEDSSRKNMQWVDKYRPTCGTEVCGNARPVSQLNMWLRHWLYKRGVQKSRSRADQTDDAMDAEEEEFCNIVILHGPVGSGKTGAVYACARELGFRVLEVKPDEKRQGSDVRKRVLEATQSHRVVGVNSDCVNPADKAEVEDSAWTSGLQSEITLVLFEQADVVFDDETGFYAAIKELSRVTKCPIVLTSERDLSASLGGVDFISYQFSLPELRELVYSLAVICVAEGMSISHTQLVQLSHICRMDIRAALYTLQFANPLPKPNSTPTTGRKHGLAAVYCELESVDIEDLHSFVRTGMASDLQIPVPPAVYPDYVQHFQYIPCVTKVDPFLIQPAEHTWVTLSGRNFLQGSSCNLLDKLNIYPIVVTAGNRRCESVTINDSEVKVLFPAHFAPGLYPIHVRLAGLCSSFSSSICVCIRSPAPKCSIRGVTLKLKEQKAKQGKKRKRYQKIRKHIDMQRRMELNGEVLDDVVSDEIEEFDEPVLTPAPEVQGEELVYLSDDSDCDALDAHPNAQSMDVSSTSLSMKEIEQEEKAQSGHDTKISIKRSRRILDDDDDEQRDIRSFEHPECQESHATSLQATGATTAIDDTISGREGAVGGMTEPFTKPSMDDLCQRYEQAVKLREFTTSGPDVLSSYHFRTHQMNSSQCSALEHVFETLDVCSYADIISTGVCEPDGDVYCTVGTGRRGSVRDTDLDWTLEDEHVQGSAMCTARAVDVSLRYLARILLRTAVSKLAEEHPQEWEILLRAFVVEKESAVDPVASFISLDAASTADITIRESHFVAEASTTSTDGFTVNSTNSLACHDSSESEKEFIPSSDEDTPIVTDADLCCSSPLQAKDYLDDSTGYIQQAVHDRVRKQHMRRCTEIMQRIQTSCVIGKESEGGGPIVVMDFIPFISRMLTLETMQTKLTAHNNENGFDVGVRTRTRANRSRAQLLHFQEVLGVKGRSYEELRSLGTISGTDGYRQQM